MPAPWALSRIGQRQPMAIAASLPGGGGGSVGGLDMVVLLHSDRASGDREDKTRERGLAAYRSVQVGRKLAKRQRLRRAKLQFLAALALRRLIDRADC